MMEMRTTLYRILFPAALVMMLSACVKEEIPGGTGEREGDSIILDIASETLPITRAVASGAEIAVDHLDVLIFEENGAYKWYERISNLNSSREGSVTLSAKREDFVAGIGYWVYLVANSSHAAADFDNIDLNGLRSMVEKTENIHLTGWQGSQTLTVPKNFLMDGVAYPGDEAEPANPGTVVLNDGVAANDTELKVTLRRAAAKIVVKIAKGEQVEFTDKGNAGFYLSNMPWTTSVVSGVDAPAELDTPEIFTARGTQFYDWTADEITVTTYAYAHEWADVSALENELRLVVNIPLTYIPEQSPDDEKAGVYEDCYYQIPVSRDKILERNTCYEVSVTVNTPGATNPVEPVQLDEISYEVMPWTTKTIDVGGDMEDAAYLSLNRYELELHNIEDDETSLIFASSSSVSVKVDRVWYIDKFGQEQATTGDWNISRLGVSAAADAGLNGKLDIHSDLPTNNTVRYIQLTVSNQDSIERTVLIRQYPLEYITNEQSWYSYRDDFKISDTRPTTYEYAGDRVYGISLDSWNISNWNGEYEYEVAGSGWFDGFSSRNSFFTSKYAVEDSRTGKSDFYYYYYDSRGRLSRSELTEYNARLYHIVLTASSDKYTIGRPRQIYDEVSGLYVTDPGEDNAELVSPSFMIASSLCGFLAGGGNLTLDGSDNSLRIAREHCANYVEVAKDGTVYDDWRLPTKAELDIILNFQGTEDEDADAIDFLLNGNYYYHAGGRTYNSNYNVNGAEPRCVRDVYDD